MIKLDYPADLECLKENYLKIFDIENMKRRWKLVLSKYNITIEELLVGDFTFLVDKYIWYKTQNVSKRQKDIYKDIFNYEFYQKKLAAFFMNKENGINFHTCHYCNMSYINSYGIGNTYNTHLNFINWASEQEWRDRFPKQETLSNAHLCDIIKERPFKTLQEFNKKRFLHKSIELYKSMSLSNDANHFDLDHLLPKSKCPIIGLSLFNFVPSCQVCNEKLKKDKELGQTKDEWLKISPTWCDSKMADSVVIHLIPESTCSTFFELKENYNKYYIDFNTDNDKIYERFLRTFRLRDRYNYHKEFALRILELKERYTNEKCKEISNILTKGIPENEKNKYSKEQIEEDIFQELYGKDRCFSKLRSDILKQSKEKTIDY